MLDAWCKVMIGTIGGWLIIQSGIISTASNTSGGELQELPMIVVALIMVAGIVAIAAIICSGWRK